MLGASRVKLFLKIAKVLYYTIVYNYNKRSSRVFCPPVFFYVEPTDNCNYKCIMSLNSVESRTPWKNGYMSTDLFELIVTQIKEFRSILAVILHLGGEPLLHQKLEEMILVGKNNGFEFGFSTNGSLLTKKRIRSLLDSVLPRLRIVFPADKERYEYACSNGD